MRILVIDDSKATRAMIRRMLSGRDLVEVATAEEALERLSVDQSFDLMLVDWHMPEMSGIEFVRTIRRRPDCDDIRVMMVTSESNALSVVKALQAGADEYLIKPFTEDGLLQKIELLGLGK